jgi:hypothetical protein
MKTNNGIKSLAEAIILQSVEDLWDTGHADECKSFFQGEGFDICAGIAGIPSEGRSELLQMITRSTPRTTAPARRIRRPVREFAAAGRH